MRDKTPLREEDQELRYRKKKPQESKSSQRADHKHQYVKTITMYVNPYNNNITGYLWTTHCEICGRLGNVNIQDRDDFLKPEYRGLHVFMGPPTVLLSFAEIRAKYPDIPVYRSGYRTDGNDVRIR